MTTATLTKIDRKTRNAVCDTSYGMPLLGEWLRRIEAIGDPRLDAAVEGIWCGREGEARIDIEGTKSLLCVGWHNGKVEWAYVS